MGINNALRGIGSAIKNFYFPDYSGYSRSSEYEAFLKGSMQSIRKHTREGVLDAYRQLKEYATTHKVDPALMKEMIFSLGEHAAIIEMRESVALRDYASTQASLQKLKAYASMFGTKLEPDFDEIGEILNQILGSNRQSRQSLEMIVRRQ